MMAPAVAAKLPLLVSSRSTPSGAVTVTRPGLPAPPPKSPKGADLVRSRQMLAWVGRPNRFLAQEVSSLEPGRAARAR